MPDKDIAPALAPIREDNLSDLSAQVVKTLLCDHTTGKNIYWATHDYEALGPAYDYRSEILPQLITGEHGTVVRPRVLKSKGEQTDRVKDMAEVFTPSWVVKMMVDYVDIDIHTRCLELTCGEAPFLVSRYDATTGNPIAISERVGVLDRKLHLINGQQPTDENWLDLVRQAFQSTYGYEWQGDSLLLARENLLRTFVDHYVERFACMPDTSLLLEFAEIISWNLWQMDGLTYRTPREKTDQQPQAQLSFFDEAPVEASAPLCVIKVWEKGEVIKVNEIQIRQIKVQNIMKFDVIIGNPPYNQEAQQTSTSDDPVYNYFMDETYKLGDKVLLITPARFLMNAGKTPSHWNKKMLNDQHLKVMYYEGESGRIFPNISIPGGLAVTYHDITEKVGPIGEFLAFSELSTISSKVSLLMESSIKEIIYSQNKFNLKVLYKDYPELKCLIGSNGKDKRFRQIVLERFPQLFFEDSHGDSIRILGLVKRERSYRYIKWKYVEEEPWIDKYKVFVPFSNGASGTLGEKAARLISKPVIGMPKEGITQTFIGFGSFDNELEAQNLYKYITSKFARVLLGIKKVTQGNKAETWEHVPLQDFTPSSDIDWSKSIAEIDEQLFDKYGLDEQERNFIRTKVKEMA